MSRFQTTVAGLLIAAFALFNVGMPVVLYLCPMMSSESPVCDLSPAKATDRPGVTNQVPSCCAKIFVAERKTTPFVKAHDEFSGGSEIIALTVIPLSQDLSGSSTSFLLNFDPAPPGSPQPLFLLNSSLLI